MGHLKDTIYYKDAIQVIEYDFGIFYLFEHFVISEINEGVTITWEDNIKRAVEELTNIYENKSQEIIYISNRVHSYSVKPNDWFKFFRSKYNIRAYFIVTYNSHSKMTSLIEKLFFKSTFKTFENIDSAIECATEMNKNK